MARKIARCRHNKGVECARTDGHRKCWECGWNPSRQPKKIKEKKERTEMDMIPLSQIRAKSVSRARLVNDHPNPFHNLANAVITVAVDDYRQAVSDRNWDLAESLERFFHSEWYKILTDLDADILLNLLAKEARGEQIYI